MQTEQQSLRAAAGQRFWQIDALRGLALLNMLVYHAMYDWVYIFGHASGWYDIWSTHCHVWQQYICWSFILLSGYSFTLSRRPHSSKEVSVVSCNNYLSVSKNSACSSTA